MKTISTLFFAGMLMSALCVAFVACNEPKETEQKDPLEGVGMAPVPESEVPKEVTAFFEEYVSIICASIFEYEDERGVHKSLADGCVIINSADELPEIDPSYRDPKNIVTFPDPFIYPEINFDSHTLVIGMFLDNGGEYVVSQSVIADQRDATINVAIGKMDSDDFYYAMNLPDYFWGVYPKIDAKTINMNVTRNY